MMAIPRRRVYHGSFAVSPSVGSDVADLAVERADDGDGGNGRNRNDDPHDGT